MVGLYAGSNNDALAVLLEDISDAVTRLLTRADEDSYRDQMWQLCVEMVDSPDQLDKHEHEDDILHNSASSYHGVDEGVLYAAPLPSDDSLAARGAVTVAAAGAMVIAQVNYLEDSAANKSACDMSSVAGQCNFRSAVSYCESVLSEQTGLSCVVDLPAYETTPHWGR